MVGPTLWLHFQLVCLLLVHSPSCPCFCGLRSLQKSSPCTHALVEGPGPRQLWPLTPLVWKKDAFPLPFSKLGVTPTLRARFLRNSAGGGQGQEEGKVGCDTVSQISERLDRGAGAGHPNSRGWLRSRFCLPGWGHTKELDR